MGKKQTYTSEYKLQALELCKQPGRTMESVAQELGVPYKTLVGWKMSYGKKGVAAFPGHGRVVLTEYQRRIQELAGPVTSPISPPCRVGYTWR